jgi:hypothetical protein
MPSVFTVNLIVFIVSITIGFSVGHTVAIWQNQEEKIQEMEHREIAIKRAIDQAAEIHHQDNEILLSSEMKTRVSRKKMELVHDTLNQPKPSVNTDCELDDDRLHALIALYPVANSATAPAADALMRSADAAD